MKKIASVKITKQKMTIFDICHCASEGDDGPLKMIVTEARSRPRTLRNSSFHFVGFSARKK